MASPGSGVPRMRRVLFVLSLIAGTGLAAILGAALVVWVHLVPQLPSVDSLHDVRLQVPLRVYARGERLIAEYGEMRRRPLPLEAIPEALRVAVVATEDEHFRRHTGVDWRGILRAVAHLARTREKGPGGSTITMQVARNFFLGREKTYVRKLSEILLALKVERELSKDQILELYLNKIFLGHRAYGVAAAAAAYYGRNLDELDLPQLAMIAGLPQRPSRFNPITNPERAVARRNHVLRRLLEVGYLDEAGFRAAVQAPITAARHSPTVETEAPYVAEWARREVEKEFGSSAYTGSYRVHTTIDSRLQAAAVRALREALLEYDRRHGYRGPEARYDLDVLSDPDRIEETLRGVPLVGGLLPALVVRSGAKEAAVHVRDEGRAVLPFEGMKWARPYVNVDRRGPAPKEAKDVLAPGDLVRVLRTEDGWELAQAPEVQGALVAMDPEDGAILAMVGGFDFRSSKFNRGTQALRQPGSSFKPFIYASALARGFTAASVINDAPVIFDDSEVEAGWRPRNYSGKFFGPTRLREALVKSRNLVSIRLLREVGVDFALDYVQRFGFDRDRLPHSLTLALGSGEVTPLEAAAGYSVLANGGFAVHPWFIERIEDRRRETVLAAAPARVCRECAEGAKETADGDAVAPRALPAADTWILQSILRDVIRRGTGREAMELGRADLAGKTGTTNDQHDAWFCGFVPSLAVVAWVGFDDHETLGRHEVGGRAALPMWIKFMRTALAGTPERVPPPPEGLVKVRINPDTGRLADASDPDAMFETFRATELSSIYAGGAGGTRPGASPSDGGRGADSLIQQLF